MFKQLATKQPLAESACAATPAIQGMTRPPRTLEIAVRKGRHYLAAAGIPLLSLRCEQCRQWMRAFHALLSVCGDVGADVHCKMTLREKY